MFNQRTMRSIISMLLAVAMIIGVMPLSAFAATTEEYGDWTIVNETSSGTATYGDMGFTYHSPTTTIMGGTNAGQSYVRSNNCNGSASNGIVVTTGKSYCDYKATADGTLTVYVGNAATKTGYVSKTDADGKSTALASFVPGGSGDYDTTGFKVTQGTTWATVDIEVQSGDTYYVTLAGSKMFCYGAEFVPYVQVKGSIKDSFGLGSYNIKFTNKTTGESKNADVTGSDYSILLKPGYEYSAALAGSDAVKYAISASSRTVTPEKGSEAMTNDLVIEESVSYKVSGYLSGMDSIADDMKLVFVPSDTQSYENVTADIDKTNKTYSAQLVANETYTLTLQGAYDYKLASVVTVSNSSSDAVSKNVEFAKVATYAVSGKFLGLTQVRGEYETLNVNPSAITFKNVDDGYTYSGTVADGKYSVMLRAGSYQAAIVSDDYSTTTHIVVADKAVERNILLKDERKKTVEYLDTLYVGSDKAYKSVGAAIEAVKNMNRTEGQRVTIKIDPGTYREQLYIETPNITLESNGGTRDNTKITWYYGIGYKYYSAVNNCYDPYADYDKFEKGNVVKYWGSAVITTDKAEGFRASNICFENSFNKYMTDEEISDGAEPNGLESIKVARKETTNVDSREATERAAAYVNYADKTEFENCSFIGSQDTLYTTNRAAHKAYYKSCYIEGQTDFIYGDGDVVFDGCEINFCGYDGSKAAGYITANSSSTAGQAKTGYVFRSCYISYNSKRSTTSGYLGRMWGNAAKVSFINTQLQEYDMIVPEGWYAMTVDPSASTVSLTEYNTTCNGTKVDTTYRVNGAVDSINASDYTVQSIFIDNGWTPAYYTTESEKTPEFKDGLTFSSNGDLNTPNPGEKVTVGYELGDEWAKSDASRIDWYAVAEGFDDSALESVLKSATLLKSASAVSSKSFQIPMECSGKYIMAVVTPITTSGAVGTAKFIIDKERAVSSNWSDPDNSGSIAPGSGINIYLAGDSTVKDYSAAGIYNGGKTLSAGSWGEYLQSFFNSDYVTVNDYAQGGRACRSFLNEGKLDTIINNIKAGDYLFMQFGHNDCANGASYYQDRFVPLYTKDNPPTSKSSGFPTIKPVESMKTATPSALVSSDGATYYAWDCGATYKGFLQEYIDRALAKGAIPVIVTPVARMYYNSDGSIKAHHDATMTDYAPTTDYLTENNAYVTACKELYEENKDKGVLFLDAYAITEKMFTDAYAVNNNNTLGVAIMDKGDSTHSNKTGGVIQAGYIAQWIKGLGAKVSEYVVQPTKVYGEETSGDYIFTIDKDGKFTAKDKELKEQPYWSELGQKLFDSIGGKQVEDEKTVTLTFNTDEALKQYVTDADTTYTDGVYSGIYTNADGQSFKTSIYKSGISYYNNQIKYGTKASQNKPIFSFTADKAANYTISVNAATGSGKIALYSDADCKNEAAAADYTQSLVYKKTSDTAEVLYFATPDNGNMYIKDVTISYVVPKTLSLNFAASDVMTLYETEDIYTNGEYSGVYTNSDNQSFDATVYQSGIQYYNHQAQYGTKATPKTPVFSFTAPAKGMYTLTFTAGTGSATMNLYSESTCENTIVSGSVPGTVVYKKSSNTPETIYVATSAANNFYLAEATIKQEGLQAETKVKFTGAVSGIEADDTNVMMTLKGTTETINISANEYKTNGVELIVGETYVLSAKGDKGIYLGTDIVTDDSGKADLILSRIVFAFPFDFIDSYYDYKAYLEASGYGSSSVTDAYSGVTVYPNGMVLTDSYKDQYGIKTNAYSILSFKAAQSGACTVKFNTTVSGSDKLILKVNDKFAPNLTLLTNGSESELTVMANEGDLITIYTPTRSNLWYKAIDVAYNDASFLAVNSVLNSDKSEMMVYGAIDDSLADKVESVGFYYATAPVSTLADETVADESEVVYDSLSFDGNTYSADGKKVFGTVLNDIEEADNVYVYTFCKLTDGTVLYSAPVEAALK